MLKETFNHFKTAFILIAIMICLTGFIYPLAVTLIAQTVFPWQANGSLFKVKGESKGSFLIGQPFSSSSYFWGRPSATEPFPYNGNASSGSNSGPSNVTFLKTLHSRIDYLKSVNKQENQLIPVDLITTSASGLDPEISPYAAFYQASRVAHARQMSVAAVCALVDAHIQKRMFHVLGEPRVNVLQLNLALDHLETSKW